MFNRGMKATNDNDNLDSWQPIAIAVARVTKRLTEDKQSEVVSPRKETADRERERADEEKRRDIERRVRDILAMENRLRRKAN
jgi:hypothetical protein